MTDIAPGRFDALRKEIHAQSFRPEPVDARRIGAEVEFLAHDDATDLPLPLLDQRTGLIPILRRHAARHKWIERPGYGAVPRFDIVGRATITFEPGGQLEVSTVPCASVSALTALLRDIVSPLRQALLDEGVRLESIGVDPYNDARDIPLQLSVDRYERMTRYFESIGPYGIRMMRQTAAIQISIDRGTAPSERWRLLNDLAPYLIAIFANSPHYLGAETGHRSYRAHCWRGLDASRTGVSVADDDAAAAYTRFALTANDIHAASGAETYLPFSRRIADGASDAAWQAHLTTLFPEVRPRGHFEVRSCDAIDPRWVAAPIVLIAGLAYDEHAAKEASLLAADSRALLRAAGETGLGDTAIARTARDLFQLALDGARRLGSAYVDANDLGVAEDFFRDHTARGRSPADDRTLRSRRSETLSAGRSR